MNQPNHRKASLRAADLIEQQLSVLTLSVPAVAKAFESGGGGGVDPGLFEKTVRSKRLSLVKTPSGGNIVAEKAEFPDKTPPESVRDDTDAYPPAQDMNDCLRVMVGNSLVTVATFMKRHDMLDMRTPEFQFLGHVVDAVLNDNTFDIPQGYMPTASFDGMVIDSKLHGTPLIAEGTAHGFMEYGDAIALLRWLLCYLRGERRFVSGGDAG